MAVWKNSIGRYTAHPGRIVRANNLKDLQDAIKAAEQRNLSLRAVGSGHSYSDVAITPTGGIMLDMYGIDHFRIYPKTLRRDAVMNDKLVEVGAGVTIKALNKHLDRQGFGIKNMGGIDHQTISGASATGTHGTGITLPSLPGMIRSIELVAAGGKVYRIEPENGITSPNRFNDANVEFIQDDDTFHAAILNLGCFGVVHSLVLEVDNQYWLREEKKLTTWGKVVPLLRNGDIHREPNLRGVMVQISPYNKDGNANDHGNHTCIVVKHYLTKKPRFRGYQALTRNLLPGIGNNKFIFNMAMRRLKKKPSRAKGNIETALRSVKDKRYINRAHRVLYQGVDNIKELGFDPEFAFAVGPGKYIDALDEMFTMAENSGKNEGIYQSSPMGLRFVDKSDALISPEWKGKVAYIDAPFLLGTPKADILLDRYQEIMLRHGGIPHWGKINTILDNNLNKIKEYYDHLDTWQTVMRRFNPNGTFDNAFSKRLGLSLPINGNNGPVA